MIERKKKICKTCNEPKFIWAHGNCKYCAAKKNPPKKLGHSKQRRTVVEKDTELYNEIWKERADASGDHWCEECLLQHGKKIRSYLPDPWNRAYFSHNLTKGAHPALRRVKENFSLLHQKCHNKWEFGDRTSMLIYEKLKPVIRKLRDLENAM